MKSIIYANTELLTGDAIAVGVLHYSAALADNGLAETIEIPVLDPDGSRSTALMLIGPASQIVAHATCLARFADDVPETLRKKQAAEPDEWREVRLIAPTTVFERNFDLDLGGLTVQLAHLPGHTVDCIVAYLHQVTLHRHARLRDNLAGDGTGSDTHRRFARGRAPAA